MTEDLLLKYTFQVICTISSAVFLGLMGLLWSKVKYLGSLKTTLNDIQTNGKTTNELMAHLLAFAKENRERIEVHDQLSTNIFGKTVSSKLISEGKQKYPAFSMSNRKNREDN